MNEQMIPLLTFLFGLIAEYWFIIFRNRMPKIRYSVHQSLIGTSGFDNYFGNVQVLYNNENIENLYLFNVEFTNTTNKDFSDIIVKIWCDVSSSILSSQAVKAGSIDLLLLTKEYVKQITETDLDKASENSGRRPYVIPVLNRGDKITVTCLVKNNKSQIPLVYIDCEHAGLKFIANYKQKNMLWGIDQSHAAILGLLVSAFLLIPILHYVDSRIVAVVSTFTIGVLVIVPGLLLLKFFNRIKIVVKNIM